MQMPMVLVRTSVHMDNTHFSHTHTHTHTHTRTHTHTHAHTHTAFGQISLLTDMAIEAKKKGLTIADAEDGA